jgi:hypothetical protein
MVASSQLLLLICVAAGCAALDAQEPGRALFRGMVTTDHGQLPVAGAEIEFREAARSVRAGSDGRFAVGALPAGTYTVLVRRPGYRPITGTVKLAATDTIDWKFDMIATPGTELAPVEVTVNPDSARTGLRDFERRRRTTSGKFLTESDIGRIGSTNLANVIRTKVSGFDLVTHPSGSGTALASRRSGAPSSYGLNNCYTAVWLNGQLFYQPSAYEPPPRLEDFRLEEVAGIEFYRVSEVPPELQFRSGNCGAIVLWTLIPKRKYPPPE